MRRPQKHKTHIFHFQTHPTLFNCEYQDKHKRLLQYLLVFIAVVLERNIDPTLVFSSHLCQERE